MLTDPGASSEIDFPHRIVFYTITKHSGPSFLASFTLEETCLQSIFSAGNGLSNVFKNSGSNFGSSHHK